MSDSECTCNSPQKETKGCYVCGTTWEEEMNYPTKIQNCKTHKNSIAVCSFAVPICSSCQNKGYTVTIGLGFAPPILYLNDQQIERPM